MTNNIELTHRIEDVGSARIHWVEAGSGPVVLMVHGFPESWYSWRNQLPVLAAAGYRAVAIDVRGYGRSSKPLDVDAYRMVRNVSDIVGVVDALGSDDVTLVGHDWGAPIVWNSALMRPDLFRGVAGLSVPYSPPGGSVRPTANMRQMAGENEFYIEYFQQPGRAEAEIEADIRQWLLGFYWCASGSISGGPNVSIVPRGTQMKEQFLYPEQMPDWLSDQDLDHYAREFEYSGFFGPLGRYRNVDRDWEDLAGLAGQPIRIPALFIGGDRDGPTIWGGAAIERFSETLPELTRAEILPGCGHWTQQERAAETNELLLAFLAAIH